MLYDLIIIGGGPDGITAGIYAARKKIKTLLITKEWGGQITKAIDIENWPGTKKISGMDLMKNMTEHLKEFEIEIKENKEIIDLDKKGDNFILNDGEQTYEGKSVIIATGKIPRTLNISGEEEFRGRGVSVCSTCDAPIFKDKNVAVIGGGNSGFNVALDVIKYAKKVYILEFFEEMKGDAISKDKLAQSGIVEFVTNVSVKEIKGTKFVESLIYKNKKTGEKI